MTSTDITTRPIFDDVDLKAIGSYNDALALVKGFTERFDVPLESIVDYGTGFTVLSKKDKDKLVDVPFIALQWSFRDGDYGEDGFVSVEVVTNAGDKFIINDGSSGIRKQLAEVTDARLKAGHPYPQAILHCPNGLSKTDYYYNEDTKESASRLPEGAVVGKDGWGPASTFYLAS